MPWFSKELKHKLTWWSPLSKYFLESKELLYDQFAVLKHAVWELRESNPKL